MSVARTATATRILVAQAEACRNEAEWQNLVMGFARSHGWRVVHFHDSRRARRDGSMFGDRDAAGWPDLTLMHPDRGIVYAELKGPKGRLTAVQRSMLDDLVAAGGVAFVWWPRDAAEVASTLTC